MNDRAPNKLTGANSRPASQFERRGLRRRALVVERHGHYDGGAAVARADDLGCQCGRAGPPASLSSGVRRSPFSP